MSITLSVRFIRALRRSMRPWRPAALLSHLEGFD